jgi:hypothetical protein
VLRHIGLQSDENKCARHTGKRSDAAPPSYGGQASHFEGGVAHQVGFFPQSSARIAYLLALKLDALRCG